MTAEEEVRLRRALAELRKIVELFVACCKDGWVPLSDGSYRRKAEEALERSKDL